MAEDGDGNDDDHDEEELISQVKMSRCNFLKVPNNCVGDHPQLCDVNEGVEQ